MTDPEPTPTETFCEGVEAYYYRDADNDVFRNGRVLSAPCEAVSNDTSRWNRYCQLNNVSNTAFTKTCTDYLEANPAIVDDDTFVYQSLIKQPVKDWPLNTVATPAYAAGTTTNNPAIHADMYDLLQGGGTYVYIASYIIFDYVPVHVAVGTWPDVASTFKAVPSLPTNVTVGTVGGDGTFFFARMTNPRDLTTVSSIYKYHPVTDTAPAKVLDLPAGMTVLEMSASNSDHHLVLATLDGTTVARGYAVVDVQAMTVHVVVNQPLQPYVNFFFLPIVLDGGNTLVITIQSTQPTQVWKRYVVKKPANASWSSAGDVVWHEVTYRGSTDTHGRPDANGYVTSWSSDTLVALDTANNTTTAHPFTSPSDSSIVHAYPIPGAPSGHLAIITKGGELFHSTNRGATTTHSLDWPWSGMRQTGDWGGIHNNQLLLPAANQSLVAFDIDPAKPWSTFGQMLTDSGNRLRLLDNGCLQLLQPATDAVRMDGVGNDTSISNQSLIDQSRFTVLSRHQDPAQRSAVSPNGRYSVAVDQDTKTVTLVENAVNSPQFAQFCEAGSSALSDECTKTFGRYCGTRRYDATDPSGQPTNEYTDDRCWCYDKDAVLASMFNVAQLKQTPGLYQQLLEIAPCISKRCTPLRSEPSVFGAWYRGQDCSSSITICTSVLNIADQGAINGAAVIQMDCGGATSKGIPCGSCPAGMACLPQTGFCEPICSSSVPCADTTATCLDDLGVCKPAAAGGGGDETSDGTLSTTTIVAIVASVVVVAALGIGLGVYYGVVRKRSGKS